MEAESVVAVGGLVIRPPGLNQHVSLAQHVQQRVAPQARVRPLQRLLEQVVQLARAQPGLAQAHATHKLNHRLAARTALLLAMQLLVAGMAADAPIAASPRHAQPREEVLREDLPKGFLRHAPLSPSSAHRSLPRTTGPSRWPLEAGLPRP